MGAQGLIAVGVPPQPLWLLYIKIAVLVISLIVLALSAYALSLFAAGAGGMDIFIAILSFIVYGTAGALELWAPQHFYRIGALIGYILTVIFWLAAWAWSASEASIWLRGVGWYYGHSYYNSLGGALGGCAGLGAIAWILTIVHLAFFIRACVVDTTAGSGQAELGQVKAEVPPQQYQQPYPEQQPYPAQQQPYPPQ
ncbi:hypothetical protein C8A01DRAFT_17891 [Parachaetomium inaequale]|uniref:MARVEL domain-containing protein n=1 Tax=Parachaetomium inaequale TaxID=2588326 RepID=A0AAN6PBR9_9PEZI|nr:hypothetical protein C8A01DRAFT_17891 [Parachaetomium inaequale]